MRVEAEARVDELVAQFGGEPRLRSASSMKTSTRAWWASWPAHQGPLPPPELRVCARGADGLFKGLGPLHPGFHLRDALDLITKREPDLLVVRRPRHSRCRPAARCQHRPLDAALKSVARSG